MSRKFLTALDLSKNELQNPAMHNLGAAPSSPVKGQVYFNTTDNTLYWWDGTTWQSAKGGAAPATTTSLGTIQLAGDLTGTATSPQIAAGAVGSAEIADGSIALGDLAFTPITSGGAAGGDLTGTYPNPQIASGVIVIGDTAPSFDLGALATAHPTTTDVSLNGKRLLSVGDPLNATDGANKQYVDTAIQGLDAKQSVICATTPAGGNITLSGTQTIDGIAVVAGNRVLVKNQTAQADNGIYVVAAGAWTRAPDADTWAEHVSAFTFVEQGVVNPDTGWVCLANQAGTLGTTAIVWSQFSGAGTISAGNGLTQSGNVLNVVAGDTSLTVTADAISVNTAVIAALASPAFTGNPTAPTQTAGDNDTSIATTAFVTTAVAAVPAAKRFAADVGGATSQVLNHNFNTRDVEVYVYRNSTPWDRVDCDMEHTDANNVTLRFTAAPAAAEFRAVIFA